LRTLAAALSAPDCRGNREAKGGRFARASLSTIDTARVVLATALGALGCEAAVAAERGRVSTSIKLCDCETEGKAIIKWVSDILIGAKCAEI
jgi:hypothetical protein